MNHYQTALPAEVLAIITITCAVAVWKRAIRPFLDDRVKYYRRHTIARLKAKIERLDFDCSDEQRRLRMLIQAGVYLLSNILYLLLFSTLGVLFSISSKIVVDNTALKYSYIAIEILMSIAVIFCSIDNSNSLERFYSLINYEYYKQRFETRLRRLEEMP